MFRSLMILGVLALAAFMAGWFTVHRDENETTIRFDRDEIRSDTSKAIAKGREILNRNGNSSNSAPDDQSTGSSFQNPNTTSEYGNYPGAYPPPGTPNNDPRFGSPTQSASRPSPPWAQSRK